MATERSLPRLLMERYPGATIQAGREPGTLDVYLSGLVGSIVIYLEGKEPRPVRVLFTRTAQIYLHKKLGVMRALDLVDELREQERATLTAPEAEPV